MMKSTIRKCTIVEILTERSETGDAWSTILLGLYFLFEIGVDKDERKAFLLFDLAFAYTEDDKLKNRLADILKGTCGEKARKSGWCPKLSAYLELQESIIDNSEVDLLGGLSPDEVECTQKNKADQAWSELCKRCGFGLSATLDGAVDSADLGFRDIFGGGITGRAPASTSEINRRDVVRRIRRIAGLGSPQAQFVLARMYLDGFWVRKSKSKSREWLEKSANQKLYEALFVLGCYYFFREGNMLGLELLEEASAIPRWSKMSQGDNLPFRFRVPGSAADYYLGLAYERLNEDPNTIPEHAIEHYKRAIDGRCDDALRQVVWMYERTRNTDKAEQLCQEHLFENVWFYTLDSTDDQSCVFERLREYAKIDRYYMRGEYKTLEEWAKVAGVDEKTLRARIESGLDEEQVLEVMCQPD